MCHDQIRRVLPIFPELTLFYGGVGGGEASVFRLTAGRLLAL
jgi:hypothetical protein